MTPLQLATLHAFVMYKPGKYRRDVLAELGVTCYVKDPTIESLISLGFLDVNKAGVIGRNRAKIDTELAQHHAPDGFYLENASLVFKRREP